MQDLKRTNTNALVSDDFNEYKAAKQRNKNAFIIQNLNKRVNQLEQCVQLLSEKLRKLENNGN